MEPTIQSGDVILIRKRDAGSLLLRLLNWKPWWFRRNTEKNFEVTADPVERNGNVTNKDNKDRFNATWFRLEDDDSYLWISPALASPLVLPGHVVVYRNPYQFPEYLVKRAVAVGGQRIFSTDPRVIPLDGDTIELQQLESAPYSMSEYLYQKRHFQFQHRFRFNVHIPPHFLYTEGDNPVTSIHDSRHMDHKPISQNLVVGIAECVIWPPSRWQRIHRRSYQNTSQNQRVIWEKYR